MPGRLAILILLTSVAVSACGNGDARPPAKPASPLPPAAVTRSVNVGPTPSALALGGGAVWVVDAAAGTLSRLDATSRKITRRVPVAGGPLAVAVGEDAAWVAAGDGAIRAYDLRSGRPTGIEASVPGANGIAAGEGGVWVTSRLAGTVTRIDPATGAADPPTQVGSGPADVVTGLGAIWVLNAADGTVSRIDPTIAEVTDVIATGGEEARALAIDAEALWAARVSGEFGEDVEVVRIDPDSLDVVGDPVPVPGAVPLDLAAGGGSVWVTDPGDRRSDGAPRTGGLTRISAAAQAIAGRSLRTGRGSSAVATDGNRTWVASTQDGTVTLITARDDE